MPCPFRSLWVLRDSLRENVGVNSTLARTKTSKQNTRVNKQVRAAVTKALKTVEETKYFDQYAAGSLAPAGALVCLSDITRGTDVIQRIGNNVKFKHLSFKFTTTIHPNGINAYMRVIIVVDKQGYNAPVISDIMEPIGLSSPFVAVLQHRWDYKHRFTTLYDKKVVLTQAALTANELEAEIKLNLTSYNIGASTTFANQLYLLLLSTEQNVLALPGYYWYSRLQFTDS